MGKAVKQIGGSVGKLLQPVGAAFGIGGGRRQSFDPIGVNKQPFELAETEADRQRAQTATQGTQQLLGQLQQQAAGQGPSLAGAQLKAAQDRSLAQQLAAASAGRGANPATIQRALMRQASQGRREMAEASAQARMQEQLQAQQSLASVLAQERAATDAQRLERQRMLQDYERLRLGDVQGARAATEASRAAANERLYGTIGNLFQAGGSAMLMSDERQKTEVKPMDKTRAFFSALAGQKRSGSDEKDDKPTSAKSIMEALAGDSPSNPLAQAKLSTRPAISSMTASNLMKGLPIGSQAAGASAAPMIAGGASSMPMLMPMSDEREKKSVKSAKVEEFLKALKPYSYKYRNPKAPGASPGRQVGVMAQDLEKSTMGKRMVLEDQDGVKYVDPARGFGAVLAAQAHLHKRLAELEKKGKKNG